jgi:ABC-type multidrug transport system ATPase subunit
MDKEKLLLEVINLSKEYRNGNRTVIANNTVSCKIHQGEAIGLIGENGAGKTTLIKQIVGLVKITKGAIVFNRDILTKETIGYMGQKYTDVFDHLTVEESLRYAAALKGLSRGECVRRTEELLDQFEFKNMRDKYIRNLSLGQYQVVNFCIAITAPSTLLVLDEPLSNLDAFYKQKVIGCLNDMVARNSSLIIVSHNLYETENIVTRILLMKNGRIIEDCSLAEIKQKFDRNVYLHLDTAAAPSIKQRLLSYAGQNNYPIQCTANSLVLTVPFSQADRLLSFMVQEEIYKYAKDFKLQCGTLENVFINALKN